MSRQATDGPLVCCVVLTWNNFADTDECLRSLRALVYRPLWIIVVNNASTDDSIERLKERWADEVTFVDSGSNHSIPFGYNRGLEEALALGAEYICLVDNDVVVAPSFVEALLEPFGASERTALVAPVMMNYYNRERVWFAGSSYNRLLGLTVNHQQGHALRELRRRGQCFPTDLAPTCAVMFSRDALLKVGLFDEALAFSHDDVDWCLRAASMGLECLVVGEPLAWHKISATRGLKGTSVQGPRAAHDEAMGAYLVARKHLRGLRWLPFLFGRLILSLPYQSVRMARAGAWRSLLAYAAGTVDGLASYLGFRSSGVTKAERQTATRS